jgi:predicted nucleotidyltransferase
MHVPSTATVPDSPVIQALRRHFDEQGGPGIISAYLHGSHAGGRPHRESDLDVAVLLDRSVYPNRSQRTELRVRLGSDLVAATGTNEIDLVILNDLPPLFARRIVCEGQRIFCTDPEADRVFVRDARLRAADLEPFLRKMEAIKREAVRK